MAGRPSKYRVEYGEKIYNFMKTGKSISAAAEMIGVHRDTLYEWEKVWPEFGEWFKRARQAACTYWEGVLEEMALDGEAKSSPRYKAIELILASRFKDLYAKSSKQEVAVNYTQNMDEKDLNSRIDMLLGKDTDGEQ